MGSQAESERKLVSVLVPVYNAAQYLPETMASLLRQTYGTIEILLQDDGSIDGSLELCRWYAQREPRVRVLEPFERNRGVVAARNALLQAARGDYICWSDSDDVSAPDRIEKQVAFLRAHPEVGAVGTGIYHADPNLNRLSEQYFPEDSERQRNDPEICCATVMATRDAVRAAGPMQAAFDVGGEDGDWILRVGDHYPVTNIAEPLYTYRHHGASLTKNRNQAAFIRRLGVMARASARARRVNGPDFVRELDPTRLAEQLGVSAILGQPLLTADEKMLALSLSCEGEAPALSIGVVTDSAADLRRLVAALDVQSLRSLELLVAAPKGRREALESSLPPTDLRTTVRFVRYEKGEEPWLMLLRAARGAFFMAGRNASWPSASKCWEAVRRCLDTPGMNVWLYRWTSTGVGESPKVLHALDQLKHGQGEVVVRRSWALLAPAEGDDPPRTMIVDARLFDLRPLRVQVVEFARRMVQRGMMTLSPRRWRGRLRQRTIEMLSRLLARPGMRRLNAMPIMRGPRRVARRLLGLPAASGAPATTTVVRPRPVGGSTAPLITVAVYESWGDFDDAVRFLTPNGEGCWGGVAFRPAAEVTDPDYVLIFNLPQEEEVRIVAPPERVWFAIGEPPTAWHRPFHLGQGKGTVVLTSDTEVTAQGDGERTYIPTPVMTRTWHVKRSLDELSRMAPFEKDRALSWVTSDIGLLDGHLKRLTFLKELKKQVPFDLYGRGFNPVADKWDGIAPYRYSIAFENTNAPLYVTEKLMDCFVSQTMPLYFGSADADRFFPSESFIRIDPDDPKVFDRIKDVIQSDLWRERRDAILEARRLVLHKYNIFSQLSKLMLERHTAASRPAEIIVTRDFLKGAA